MQIVAALKLSLLWISQLPQNADSTNFFHHILAGQVQNLTFLYHRNFVSTDVQLSFGSHVLLIYHILTLYECRLIFKHTWQGPHPELSSNLIAAQTIQDVSTNDKLTYFKYFTNEHRVNELVTENFLVAPDKVGVIGSQFKTWFLWKKATGTQLIWSHAKCLGHTFVQDMSNFKDADLSFIKTGFT